MRYAGLLILALLAAGTVAGSPAVAAICQAEKLTCATTMPIGGYCECRSHGRTEDGTVVDRSPPHKPINSTAAGCGAEPNAPGCR
jgi:hypothetical protein